MSFLQTAATAAMSSAATSKFYELPEATEASARDLTDKSALNLLSTLLPNSSDGVAGQPLPNRSRTGGRNRTSGN